MTIQEMAQFALEQAADEQRREAEQSEVEGFAYGVPSVPSLPQLGGRKVGLPGGVKSPIGDFGPGKLMVCKGCHGG